MEIIVDITNSVTLLVKICACDCRHLPPGLCFHEDSGAAKTEGENAGNSSADGPDQAQPKEVKGVTLDCRYSYNNDPAKYNEQPLPATSAISIRPARGKQVRNIRLRPRQTLCSKCKAAIHDSKSKSPNKVPKPDGQEQEAHPHNTRYRAAQSNKPSDTPNTPPGPTLRSGSRNRRADSTPKVLLENIRPKREVKPTAKKREADAAQKSRLENSKKHAMHDERTGDGAKCDINKTLESAVGDKKEEEGSRMMSERSLSLDNPTSFSQYNKQPVVRLDKSAINSMSIRTENKEEKQEKAPTISIVNIRSTPAIKISFGGAGDRDVLKIPPRLPGADMKSPDDHSTADESPAPITPPPPPSPPQKKTKKASKRTRDKQRYRVVNDGDAASEIHAPGIKITGYHRKHKRKHRHRHASSEDENFNSEMEAPPAKLPSLITKLSVVPPVNDMNGNEKKGDSDVLKDSSNETPTRQDEIVEPLARSPPDLSEAVTVNQVRKADSSFDFTFDDDPLNLKTECADSAPVSCDSQPNHKSPLHTETGFLSQPKVESGGTSPARTDVKPFEMWGSPVKTPAFETEGSPTRIEAPPFQSDDSQDGLIVGPLRMHNSPYKDENISSFDSLTNTPPTTVGMGENRKESDHEEEEEDEEQKEPVPYGVGVFEDLTPDEDEDDHDDSNVNQPIYQLPKKPHLVYSGWPNDSLSAGYLPKKADNSSLYHNQTGVYQNGPSSFFSPAAGPSSLYSSNPASSFPSSPAPRIQNSPTPIIQRSPMPIFNYSASRFQGSPNRRFGSSPSRRYHSITDSGPSRQQSVIAGSVGHSRYQVHEGDRFHVSGKNHSSSSSAYRGHGEGDVSQPAPASRFPPKFDSQSTIRYQPASDKSAGSRYPSQSESSSVSRLPSTEDSALGAKSQGASESTSTPRYAWSSGDSSSAPRFAIPSSGSSSSVPQYRGQGGSGSLSGYSAHPSEGSLPNQYPALGSTDSRFQPHTETHYKAHGSTGIPSSPSPLSLQTNNRSATALGTGSTYHDEKERKNIVLPAPHYETVDTSALFMTHSHIHNSTSSGESSSVPVFLKKTSTSSSQNAVDRLQSRESPKPISLYTGSGPTPPVPMFHQNTKLLSGTGTGTQGPGVLMGQSGSSSSSSITRHPSSSSLSQGHLSVTVGLSDSEDEMDNAVPGFVPTSSTLSSQDSSRVPMMKIQTQNLASCLTEDRREIRVGDVQWGKVQGFPWWPCRVVAIKLTHRDHREQELIITQVCHVSWFGSSTVSDLHPSELRPFREEFAKRHVKKKRGPYQVAVQQALLATESHLPSIDASHLHTQSQPISLNPMHDLVS